ncbi:MAG: putative PEP-CTERM system TPR-repeat lipoprotein [Paraglaciecola sp.]|jgi:putative PEP-CTERM system TPR-repeat lipoprotein
MNYRHLAGLFFILNLLTICSVRAQSNSHYEKALQAFTAKEYNESYIHLKNALKDNPSDLAAKILMGNMFLVNGYFDASVTEFEEALLAGADPNLVINPYIKSLLLTKRFSQILSLKDNNLDSNNQFELTLAKATAFGSLSEDKQAEKNYLQALTMRPNNIRALNGMASLFLKNNDLVSANKFINESLQASSNNAGAWRLRGLVQKEEGTPEMARKSFKNAFELTPDDPFILRAYASSLWEAKELKKAQDVVNLILSRTPNDRTAILLQSQIFSASGETKKAQDLLSKLSLELSTLTAEKDEENLSLRYTSGITAYLNHNYEQAFSDLNYYVNNSKLEISGISMLADTYMHLNKERSALKLLQTYERIVVEDLDTSLLLCDLYVKNNRAFKCEALLNVLKKSFPNKVRVDFMQAKTQMVRRKYDEALATLNGVADPAYRHQKKLAIAHLYFQTKNYKASHELAKQLLEELPDDVDILNLNVVLLAKSKNWQQASQLVAKIFELSPNYVAAKYNKANLLGVSGDFDSALGIMQSLEAEGALDPNAFVLYAQILSSMGNKDLAIEKLRNAGKLAKDSIPISEKLIELYSQTGRLEDALFEIQRHERKTLTEDKYPLTKADLLLKLGRGKDAKELRQALYLKWFDSFQDLIPLSDIQRLADDFDGAEKSLLRALEITKNKDLRGLLKLERLYSSTEKFESAQKYLLIADKLYPKNVEVMVAKGRLAISLLNLQGAYDILWQAINIDADFTPTYAQLYRLSSKGMGTDRLISLLEVTVRKSPQKNFHRNLLADIYLKQGDMLKAKVHYEVLIADKRYNNRAAALNNLAIIELPVNPANSLQLIERALELAPLSPSLLDTKGWVYTAQGNYSQALVILRQAFSMNSSDPTIRYHLAYTLHKLGRVNEARSEVQQALALNQEFSEREEAEKLLKSM